MNVVARQEMIRCDHCGGTTVRWEWQQYDHGPRRICIFCQGRVIEAKPLRIFRNDGGDSHLLQILGREFPDKLNSPAIEFTELIKKTEFIQERALWYYEKADLLYTFIEAVKAREK